MRARGIVKGSGRRGYGVLLHPTERTVMGDKTDVYLRLNYDEYKVLEDQLRNWSQIETSHTTVDGYYHKALRLSLGNLTLEVQGPAVKEPIRHEPATPTDH